jgi:hypothetical protein
MKKKIRKPPMVVHRSIARKKLKILARTELNPKIRSWNFPIEIGIMIVKKFVINTARNVIPTKRRFLDIKDLSMDHLECSIAE